MKLLALSLCIFLISPTNGFWHSIMLYFGYEVCGQPSIRNAETATRFLTLYLDEELFGQHLVKYEITTEVYRHLAEEFPPKPLTISLHGSTGSGKSLTANILMKSIYSKGDKSQFVRFFSSSYHFPDPEKVLQYKQWLKTEIREKVAACPRALFIFDEVDKLPAGLLDVLVPIIQHPGQMLDGNDYKKAIFMFLGNAGSQAINDVTLKFHNKREKREDLSIHHFQHILSNEAFNSKGGWYQSELIDKILVKKFIPFLPLERRHILECIRSLASDFPGTRFTEKDFESIADGITYWPTGTELFSETGCKRVENLLLPLVEKQKKLAKKDEV